MESTVDLRQLKVRPIYPHENDHWNQLMTAHYYLGHHRVNPSFLDKTLE
ncbi:hypothetical protein [Alicyclobacillus sp. SP_1]|jgi:hypothetical protein|nr:hypothetical protein [Alicyclobacillus sp. SP_1]